MADLVLTLTPKSLFPYFIMYAPLTKKKIKNKVTIWQYFKWLE